MKEKNYQEVNNRLLELLYSLAVVFCQNIFDFFNMMNTILVCFILGIIIVISIKKFPIFLEFIQENIVNLQEQEIISIVFFIIILAWIISGRLKSFKLANIADKLKIITSDEKNNFSTGRMNNSNYSTARGCALWGGVFFCIISLYSYRHEFEDFKERIISSIFPSYEIIKDLEISLKKHSDGHFYLKAQIVNEGTNGNDYSSTVKFLVDTGASGVAISSLDAKRMGIDTSKLRYDQVYQTANGPAYSAAIRIKKLVIGKKVFSDVRAHVSQGGLDVSLLGMSILENFSDVRFVNDDLILKY